MFVLRGMDEEIKSRPSDLGFTSAHSSPSSSGHRDTQFAARLQIRNERELMRTPRASEKLITDVCRGAPFVQIPTSMKILGKVLPVVIFLSLVLLFVCPPCAAVFVGSSLWYWHVKKQTKKFIEIGERNRPVPSFTCPTPTRNMLY